MLGWGHHGIGRWLLQRIHVILAKSFIGLGFYSWLGLLMAAETRETLFLITCVRDLFFRAFAREERVSQVLPMCICRNLFLTRF